MYLSFRLSSECERSLPLYLLLETVFIVVLSVLSTFVYLLWVWILLLYPFWLVSFPFFSTPELRARANVYFPRRAPIHAGEIDVRAHLVGYDINFFGVKIVSISPQNLVYGFSFYLLINILGAIVGYLTNRLLRDRSFEWNLFNFFFRTGIVSFLVCYGITWLGWFALGLIVWYGVNGIWFALVENVLFFCQFFFWIPAVIATLIYGARSRTKNLSRD